MLGSSPVSLNRHSLLRSPVKVDLFDYNLPPERIAQHPAPKRDDSRLLVLARDGSRTHTTFNALVDHVPQGALMVFNDTRVIPARLFTIKRTGGRVELLLTRQHNNHPDQWHAIFRASRRPKEGELLSLEHLPELPPIQVLVSGSERELLLRLPCKTLYGDPSPWPYLEEHGHIPLPPYITRQDTGGDRLRYQTVYAKTPGAVAAPTAGLHFTPQLLDALKEKGVSLSTLTLHVGVGTFSPVKVEDTKDHKMHEEFYHIPKSLVQTVSALPEGAPIIAVGTTTLRALEAAALGSRTLRPGSGSTAIFITPGYTFSVVDALITNFHLPRSTLLMLVSALRNRESILETYEEAVQLGYRFFSYGDAMFIQ